MSIKKAVLVFAVFFCTNSYGGVYKCADANGHIAYSKTACNSKSDGRTYCSQMTSCEEATFFIKNCPDTKMDGDMDGIPCERQWCD